MQKRQYLTATWISQVPGKVACQNNYNGTENIFGVVVNDDPVSNNATLYRAAGPTTSLGGDVGGAVTFVLS